MVVGKLTLEQKNKLLDREFVQDMSFNPFQDINDNWCLSIEEIEQTTIKWVKSIQLIEFQPKIIKLHIL